MGAAAPVRAGRWHHGQDHRDLEHDGRGARAPLGGVDRSHPRGRAAGGGTDAGSSPAWMRSVHSAKRRTCPPSVVFKVPMVLTMVPPPGPDWSRRAHASTELLDVPNAAGISHVALSPSW